METTPFSNVIENKNCSNHKNSVTNTQQHHNSCVTAQNTLKRVHTATAIGTAKVTRLCACTQQYQEVCGPAGQGERTLRATHTPAAAQAHRLCAQPPHHVAGPRASSEECAERAHHTDPHKKQQVYCPYHWQIHQLTLSSWKKY